MVNHTYADLFKKDNVKKDLILDFGDFQITNNRLYSEAFELSESLCSQNELRFGCCEASVLKFKCRNEFGELKDRWFDVSMSLNGHTDTPFQIGSYRVFDSKPSGDRLYTNVTAYDAMYGVINAEMVEWYDGLTFPITMKDFRDSFFEYLGLEQVEVELVNDDMLIEKTIDADSIAGKQIITAICELNGVFGHINRQGLFAYISLADKVGLYPSIELYPSNALLPINGPYDARTDVLNTSKYISCEYEEFETSFISKLQIRQEQNDIGVVVGEEANTYIVEDNFLVYGKGTEDLKTIANNLFAKIKDVQYRPFNLSLRGNPCLEVGDSIVIHTKYKNVESYVLERTIKGIQALKDTFESKGVYEYAEKVNSVQRDIKKLKGKTSVLERTVEKLGSTITDEENGLQTQIAQNANAIKTKASKGELSSEISQEAGSISIKGDRISIDSKYFKLSEDGSIEATNGYFRGTFEQYNTNGIKSVEIRGNQVMVYAWHDDGNYVGSFGALRRVETDGTARGMVSMWCDYDDILTLNYNSPTDSNTKKPVLTFDPVDMENGHTPWIRNTSSGTLFPDNPDGGIVVENGLIKDWSLRGSNSTIFSDNPNGGITLKNGLVTSWSLKGATGTLYPNNPNGGILVANGLITDWSLTRVADSKLVIMSGAWINAEGYVGGFQFTDVVVKDGLIISWTARTEWLREGWIQ